MAINLAEIVRSGRKLKELILLIADLSRRDEQFGSVKLNKLLYYSDFEAYRKLEQPITCARYQHLDEGPAPMESLGAQEALIEAGDAIIEERYYGGLLQRRIVPQREPDLSLFSKEELDIVRNMLSRFKEFSGDQISKHSHKEWGWRLTRAGEVIEYRTAWLSAEPLTETDKKIGQELAEKRASS